MNPSLRNYYLNQLYIKRNQLSTANDELNKVNAAINSLKNARDSLRTVYTSTQNISSSMIQIFDKATGSVAATSIRSMTEDIDEAKRIIGDDITKATQKKNEISSRITNLNSQIRNLQWQVNRT